MELKPWPKGLISCTCCRVGDPYWNGMPNSVQRNCYNCGHAVWVSPATLAQCKIDTTEFLCVECHAAYAERRGTPTRLLPLSPAQVEERIKSNNTDSPVFGDVRKLRKPTREQFIESYVKTKLNAGMKLDLEKAREEAGGVYDILVDESPEGNKRFLESLAEISEKVVDNQQ